MTSNLVPCPNGGACGSKNHRQGSAALAQCQRTKSNPTIPSQAPSFGNPNLNFDSISSTTDRLQKVNNLREFLAEMDSADVFDTVELVTKKVSIPTDEPTLRPLKIDGERMDIVPIESRNDVAISMISYPVTPKIIYVGFIAANNDHAQNFVQMLEEDGVGSVGFRPSELLTVADDGAVMVGNRRLDDVVSDGTWNQTMDTVEDTMNDWETASAERRANDIYPPVDLYWESVVESPLTTEGHLMEHEGLQRVLNGPYGDEVRDFIRRNNRQLP